MLINGRTLIKKGFIVIFIDASLSSMYPAIERGLPKQSTILSWSRYIHVLPHL